MNLETICKHIAENSLSQAEVEKLLRGSIEPAIGQQYTKGYLRSIRDQKRRREARTVRLDVEFKKFVDFMSDLTHEKG